MNYKENYKNLLSELETLGGSIRTLRGVSNFYSLANEAKVRQEIKRLKSINNVQLTDDNVQLINKNILPKDSVPAEPTEQSLLSATSKLISDFPPELHGIYLERKHVFLQACSLKIQLNHLPDKEVNKALNLQRIILELFEKMDSFNAILDHWTEHKRVLKPQTEDFSTLSALELIKKRNVLRSNVVSREKSLKKWKADVKKLGDQAPLRLKSKIIRKTEELEQIKLTIKELDKLIK
ncbi:hypothetical protein [Capnocytophaga canis]|uniref:hypothetical protein n=1 Tax=Capnocytophaga canis TaxID=1848903 RepID=UPI00156269D9|nr:hypothetical protein [Capnocytophaga canis]